VSWSRQFDEPIKLPNGGALQTLREAGEYVAALPKAEQKMTHWQTAAYQLMMVAERGGILGQVRAANAPSVDLRPYKRDGLLSDGSKDA
jgi:hypothetical protein